MHFLTLVAIKLSKSWKYLQTDHYNRCFDRILSYLIFFCGHFCLISSLYFKQHIDFLLFCPSLVHIHAPQHEPLQRVFIWISNGPGAVLWQGFNLFCFVCTQSKSQLSDCYKQENRDSTMTSNDGTASKEAGKTVMIHSSEGGYGFMDKTLVRLVPSFARSFVCCACQPSYCLWVATNPF